MNFEGKYTKHHFKRLHLEIGNRFDGFQIVEIKNENNKLKIEYIPRKFVSDKIFSKNMGINYETFFKDLSKINIENWEADYPYKLYTGHEWKLILYFRPSIIIEKKGSNNYPNNFNEIIDFIKIFYHEFNVDINIRTKLNENDLLKLYCTYNPGFYFSEVSIGDKNIFGENSRDRKIDLVRILCDHKMIMMKFSDKKELFQKLVNDEYEVELIEIKAKLNRPVIGQIIAGKYMFLKKFTVKNVIMKILYHEGDDALELFCRENNIELTKY
jgi:hypothetical protein